MIGIIPTEKRTFDVMKVLDFTQENDNLIEGKLYIDSSSGRVYYYSKSEIRSNPDNGYFPIWNGHDKYISKFSNEKYLRDVIRVDVKDISEQIDREKAALISRTHRRMNDSRILDPQIINGDNMFTQCIKGVICAKNVTISDLVESCNGKLPITAIINYYSGLQQIAFMRLERWNIWIDTILHINWRITVFKKERQLISYDHLTDTYDTGIVDYRSIINPKNDSLKNVIKILMLKDNINKERLRSNEVDDYMINNMLSTINGRKSISGQLFSRFMRMAGLSFTIEMIENDQVLFTYNE